MNTQRRHLPMLLRILSALTILLLSNLPVRADPSLLGQGDFQYRVVPDWGREALSQVKVKNGHAVALDSQNRLLFLTDDAQNNVIILDAQSGALLKHWTARMPGAHGMTLTQEKAQEVLYITDTLLNEVRKLTLDGDELARFPWPKESGLYAKAADYRPSKILVHPDGRLWIFDGYGKDYIHAYAANGSYLKSWGGNLGEGENQLRHWGPHGGGLDLRDRDKPLIVIAMSDQQEIKTFTLDGSFLTKHPFPGGNPRDFVLMGSHSIVPHLGDQWPRDTNAPGFLSIVDQDFKIVSNIGAPPAEYKDGALQDLKSDGKTFIHPHGVCADAKGNLFVAQYDSAAAPLLKLERVK
jgi:peptidylamidoglycolate lyase